MTRARDESRKTAMNDRDQGLRTGKMDEKIGTSCWGWALWALAFFGVAAGFVYLLGGFDPATGAAVSAL